MTPFQQKAVSLVENGYRVIPIAQGEKRPSIPGWQNYEATTARVTAEWANNGNIGILTGTTPAIDIDSTDQSLAIEMEQFVTEMIGDAPVRVGRAPKRLMVFRTNEPFTKRASGFFIDEQGNSHQLEVLGEGQQFVAYGIHPDTKKPYRWISLESPSDLRVEDLPVLTARGADAAVAEFSRLCEARGWKRKTQASAGAGQDEFWFLRPKPDVSDDELRSALEKMPGADVYETWVKVGMALHDHFDGSPDGLQMWDDWSASAANYSPEQVEQKWRGFGRRNGQPVTVGFILAATREQRKVSEVKAKLTENTETRTPLLDTIRSCEDPDLLIGDVLAQVAAANLDPMGLEVALKAINARLKQLKASTISIHTLKREVKRIAQPDTQSVDMGLRLEKVVADKVLEMSFGDGAHLLYFSELWWHYANGVWRRSEENFVAKAVQECILQLTEQDDEAALELAAAVTESRGDRLGAVVNAIVAVIKRQVGQEGNDDPLDLQSHRPPRVVNCTNGELWLELDGSYSFKRHNPEHRLTSQVACEFNPKAVCPTWDAMCQKVFSSCENPDDVIRHFNEVFGYMLQPERHYAMSVMLKGPGGNGKSTLTDVVRAVMGRGAVLSFSIAELAKGANAHFTDSCQGKLMLLDDDFKAGTLLPDDWIKKFSEAKSLSANPKFGRPYEFIARCTPVLLTNGWPQTVDLSEGIRRRMMIFETSHVLTDAEKDPKHLIEVMERELPGVLNRLLQGLGRVLKRGQRFEVPTECLASKRRWVTMSNPTARFVELVVEQTDDRKDAVPATALYDAYRQWCTYDEGNVRAMGRNKFYEAMESLGLIRRNRSGVFYFSKIKLKKIEGVEDAFPDHGG